MSRRTPLIWAAHLSSDEVVHLLLRYGADINARDNRNKSALSLAAERGWSTRVAMLRKAGAKPYTPKRPEASSIP